MTRWLTRALATTALALPTLASAVAYDLPGNPPPGCSRSGSNYTCPGISLGYNDTLTVSSPTKPATVTVNGNFDTNTSQINVGGVASDLTLTISGTLTLGYQAKVKANITATAVNDTGGGGVVITGNLAATGGNISLGHQASVSGNLSTSGTGILTTGAFGSVGGNVSGGSGSITISEGSSVGGDVTGTGTITLVQNTTVSGNVSAGSGSVSLGFKSRVTGNLTTTGAVTLGQEAVVGGNVGGGTGHVSVGYGATVTGTLTTSSGTIDFAQAAKALACVKSTSSASITLGYQSSAHSVCCGGSCTNSCVVNNSTAPMPAACAATTPTLVSGTRYSFESYDVPGSYIRHSNYIGYINPVSASSDSLTRNDSTFIARPGITNPACWSFESVNIPGYYLRHQNFILKLNTYSATAPYPADATFCLRSGLANPSAISFEATNYPAYYLQHKVDTSMILATVDGTAAVNGRATFYPRAGLAPVVEHYELSVPSASLACQASTVKVTACADSSSPCTNPVTNASGQTATLATTAGTLGSGTVTFDASGSATTTLAHGAAANGGTATVTLSGESSLATSARRCCPDGASCSAANSCSTTFSTTGFLIAASANGGATTVPAQTAGTASSNFVLRAVKTNTTTKACEAALTGTTTVNWGVQCNDPATCSSGDRMTLTGSNVVAVPGNGAGSSSNSAAVSMTFDADGTAPFSFSYADVGRVTLFASKPAGGPLKAALSGSSNAFVVKPAGFVLSAIRCASYVAGSCAISAIASPGNNPGASAANGSAFMPAGRPFTATVTAVDAGGNATPNYGRETVPEGVTLTATLVEPVGGNAPALTNPSAFGSFSNGAATGATFAWPEVGIIKLTPAVADGNYLGANNVTGTASGNVGRFVPASFALTAATVTHRSGAACSPASTFSYLGEAFSLGFTLTAQNAAGAATENYEGAFARLPLTTATRFNLTGVHGATQFKTGNASLVLGTSSSAAGWVNGVASVTLPATAARATTPVGPFDSAEFGVAPVDDDGVAVASLNLNTDAVAGNDSFKVGTIPLRFGRLRLQNGMGPSNRSLSLPLEAQYWSGTAYITNTLDSCTRISATNLSFGNLRNVPAANAAMVGSGSTVTAGKGSLTLAAPGNSGRALYDIALALDGTTPPADASCLKTAAGWTPAKAATAGASATALRGAWCGSTATSDPSARATWGLYRGADGVVYQRENY
ncbi:putative acyltransferase (DUF342 family) [Pelomonas aquatica]|uniref:Acyltransferase (DUF342 family) n=1 Tax=Pelomonas aquatica TaxID=431058 RepID=A0ABU1ZFD8_9BURK|nr:DUF6701 domain-containing protein [Pelomonas aquatica]MDR7299345.1 putative acyltransferase (DUF342 family) [Pelomonas aquatica]